MALKHMKQRSKKMRGGESPVGEPYATGNLVLPQGLSYFKNAPMNMGSNMVGGDSPFYGVKPVVQLQQGGMSPYPGSDRMDAGLAAQTGTAPLDAALQEVAGLRDPNQAGGRKRKTQRKSKKTQRKSKKTQRKSKKTQRKSKKTQRKSKKTQRKSKKTQRKSKKTQRKSKKTQRKSKKTQHKSKKTQHKSKKTQRKSKKSQRKSKKSQRGGVMDYPESMNGGIIDTDLLDKAGLHPSWKSVSNGNMF